MSRPERPLLAPWYRQVADGERLLLEHGRSVVCFQGAAAVSLLPALLLRLDGTRTCEELTAELGVAAGPAIERALQLLDANGLLVEGPAAGFPAAGMLAAAHGLAPAEVEERLQSAIVGVVGCSAAAEHLAALLQATGIGRVEPLGWDEDEATDLAIVAPSPAESPLLATWNRRAVEDGLPWLPVRPFDGAIHAIGPVVVPGESACFECLLLRLGSHLEYGRDVRRIESVPVAAPSTPALETVAAGVAVQLACAWIGGRDLTLPGMLYILETRPALALSSDTVLRVPRCPVCSSVARTSPPLPWHAAVLNGEEQA